MVNDVPEDTRGILDPAAMMRHVKFARYPAGDGLRGLIEWFWCVQWNVPEGRIHVQDVISHPAGNVSIGTIDNASVPLDPAQGRFYGVMTRVSRRRLTSTGWTVAARTTVGGVGVLLDAPAKAAVNTAISLDSIPGFDTGCAVHHARTCRSNEKRIGVMRNELEKLISHRTSARVAEARSVVEVAAVAESDRTVRRVEQLAATAGVSVRTLQRLFDFHVGVSPSYVIRRWRIIDAVEAARNAIGENGRWAGWGGVAAELGYADQAHLTRDFRHHLGITPSAYLAQLDQGGSEAR